VLRLQASGEGTSSFAGCGEINKRTGTAFGHCGTEITHLAGRGPIDKGEIATVVGPAPPGLSGRREEPGASAAGRGPGSGPGSGPESGPGPRGPGPRGPGELSVPVVLKRRVTTARRLLPARPPPESVSALQQRPVSARDVKHKGQLIFLNTRSHV